MNIYHFYWTLQGDKVGVLTHTYLPTQTSQEDQGGYVQLPLYLQPSVWSDGNLRQALLYNINS